MSVLDRLTDLDPRAWLERLELDPPHRVLARAIKVIRQTDMLAAAGAPLAMADIALRRGLGVRSLHALHAAASPGRPALVDRHRQLDYAGLEAEIDAAVRALHHHGLRRGEPVGMMMENRSEYVALWMALGRLGIASAHLGPSTTAAELGPVLERAGIRRLMVSEHTAQTAERVARDQPSLGLQMVHVGHRPPPGATSYHAMVRAHRHGAGPPPAGGEGAESVVFTSGTTGRPKGAVRDLSSVGVMELLRILERLPLRVGDRHLVVAPLYHSGAQAFTLINTALAATIVLVDRFEAQPVLELMSRERIASTFLVPTMTRRLLDLPASVHARNPTPALRAIVSGAAPFPDGLRRRAIERFGADAIFDFYGATELGWVTLTDGHEMLARPGTLGRPLAGQEIRVVDDQGRPLPPRSVGTIYTRSRQHMRGYLRDEAATREIQREGWVTVEDTGYLDEDGHLFLTGRSRDMVITGGVNVYPVEIEHVLSRHPAIRDVAVIGLPDPEWGERLTAVVIPGEGFELAEVDAWARDRLAKAKRPRQWQVVDELPRNPTGKILKRALRERLSASGHRDGGASEDA